MNRTFSTTKQAKIEPLYNRSSTKYTYQNLSLEPLVGPLTYDQLRHLLSRCLFGYTSADLLQVNNESVETVVNQLLEDLPFPDPPLGIDSRDADTPIGETWIDKPHNSNYNTYRLLSLNGWWFGQTLSSGISIREKLVLFWHNHFALKQELAQRADFLYEYNHCLRKNALGNLKQFTEEMILLPATLRALNGESNYAQSPNENQARTLLEYFTLGWPQEQTAEQPAYFTETDVQTAAAVLSGWTIDETTGKAYFNEGNHHTDSKVFSEHFQGTSIQNEGESEYKRLIQLLFEQEATAKNIVRKLYRWFVYYQIDETIEAEIITPLATMLQTNGYELKPVLSSLLKSQHFYDTTLRGCLIKNPIDFVTGTLKNCHFQIPGKEQLIGQYHLLNYFNNEAAKQGMGLGFPPDEAGWPAYYQSPRYHQLWINAATLSLKQQFVQTVCSADGIKQNGVFFRANWVELIKTISEPSDINQVIDQLSKQFFPKPISTQQLALLKKLIMGELSDAEWSSEWQQFENNAEDAAQREIIENEIRKLAQTIFMMAEYQLA